MLGKIAYVGLFGLIALCTGCTLPCHPYDHCGPVCDSSSGYCSNIRAGSILEGEAMHPISAAADQGVIEESAVSVQEGSPKIQEYESTKQILSVTDRKVEESETMAKSQSSDTTPNPVLAKPASSKLRWR